jgi:hypothetical protein
VSGSRVTVSYSVPPPNHSRGEHHKWYGVQNIYCAPFTYKCSKTLRTEKETLCPSSLHSFRHRNGMKSKEMAQLRLKDNGNCSVGPFEQRTEYGVRSRYNDIHGCERFYPMLSAVESGSSSRVNPRQGLVRQPLCYKYGVQVPNRVEPRRNSLAEQLGGPTHLFILPSELNFFCRMYSVVRTP